MHFYAKYQHTECANPYFYFYWSIQVTCLSHDTLIILKRGLAIYSKLTWLQNSSFLFLPYKKKYPENVIKIVWKLSRIFFHVQKMSGKMIVWNFSYPKNQTNSEHIPDMKKI